MNIDPKNKVTTSLSFLWSLACIIISGTAFLVGVYAESTGSAKDIEKLKLDVLDLQKQSESRRENDVINCLILQRIQNVVVPSHFRIERKCEK